MPAHPPPISPLNKLTADSRQPTASAKGRSAAGRNSGNSIIEILLVITLISLFTIPFMITLNRLNRKHASLSTTAQAYLITQSNLEIATNIIQSLPAWSNRPIPGTYQPPIEPNWEYLPSSQPTSIGRYQTQLTVRPVCRDPNYNLADYQANCDPDPNAIEVISTTTWIEASQTKSTTMQTIFANLTTQPNPEQEFIAICHVPPGNPENAHAIRLNKNAWNKGHTEHNAHSLDFELTDLDDPACN
jgi:hypothetical protein